MCEETTHNMPGEATTADSFPDVNHVDDGHNDNVGTFSMHSFPESIPSPGLCGRSISSYTDSIQRHSFSQPETASGHRFFSQGYSPCSVIDGYEASYDTGVRTLYADQRFLKSRHVLYCQEDLQLASRLYPVSLTASHHDQLTAHITRIRTDPAHRKKVLDKLACIWRQKDGIIASHWLDNDKQFLETLMNDIKQDKNETNIGNLLLSDEQDGEKVMFSLLQTDLRFARALACVSFYQDRQPVFETSTQISEPGQDFPSEDAENAEHASSSLSLVDLTDSANDVLQGISVGENPRTVLSSVSDGDPQGEPDIFLLSDDIDDSYRADLVSNDDLREGPDSQQGGAYNPCSSPINNPAPRTTTAATMPDYDNFMLPELKNALQKYGFKPGRRKEMIAQLRRIWEVSHPT
ncbi:uncharacterized protein BYT42DRAFT_43793 [Radiomyces spectabilis]|uniref:uncharacterized protein n=1 Tax=Radiomyces spectabilis TaxID=64574 RepID=UPI00221FCF8B|nr:uncharacterized protein BYT42DRAFT_43793 [Radiomyces spectabilis]KAI8372730.1 hypothetical protein BYT42DRAFT_43793 [Radiomyces spectabilis]